jgi:hypothetical protein
MVPAAPNPSYFGWPAITVPNPLGAYGCPLCNMDELGLDYRPIRANVNTCSTSPPGKSPASRMFATRVAGAGYFYTF